MKKISRVRSHLWQVAMGDYGTAHVYKFVLALLFIALGLFAATSTKQQSKQQELVHLIINGSMMLIGVLYLLVVLDKITKISHKALIEYSSIVLLIVNLVLSWLGENDKMDSISYGVFGLFILLLSLRTEDQDGKNH